MTTERHAVKAPYLYDKTTQNYSLPSVTTDAEKNEQTVIPCPEETTVQDVSIRICYFVERYQKGQMPQSNSGFDS